MLDNRVSLFLNAYFLQRWMCRWVGWQKNMKRVNVHVTYQNMSPPVHSTPPHSIKCMSRTFWGFSYNSFICVSSVCQNAALQHLFVRKCFRPFKCTHCGKAFRDKDKLDQHLRVHGRDAYTFSCHICNKSFTSDNALEDHLLIHTDSRTYFCILCPETFEKLDLLKDHVGVHAVDGCFTCPVCKKIFTDFIQVSKTADNVSYRVTQKS